MRAREFIIEDWNKVTPIQELERYANDPTIFISYTVLPKLGINPNPNSSDTPGGVYAYPLSMVYDDIKNDITNVPFYTSSVKYIMVFKYSGKILSTDNFSESDFKSALTRLHGWFGKILHRPNVPFHTDDYDMGEESPFNTLLEYTKTLALKKLKIPPNNINFSYDSNEKIIPPIVRPAGYVFTWNTLVKKATGYDAFISTKGTIHGGEPIQAMFLSSEKLQVISMITIPKAKKQGVAESFGDTIPIVRRAKNAIRNIGVDKISPSVHLYRNPELKGAYVKSSKAIKDLPVTTVPISSLIMWEPESKLTGAEGSEHVAQMVQAIKQGAKLPPITVTPLATGYRIIDGHHRYGAYKLAGVKNIPVRVVDRKKVLYLEKQGNLAPKKLR